MPRLLAALALLLLVAPAQGGVVFEQASSVDPATGPPPATLSPLHGGTAVGGSGTSATTPSAIRLTGPSTGLLKVANGATPHDVHLAVIARSGFASPADSVTVSVGGAGVTVAQATALPRTTAVVDLGASSEITVTASGVCVATCTLTMEIRIEPDGPGTNPTFVYPYTLLVT